MAKSKGASARTKGHQFERDMAIALRPAFPEARRQLEYHAADARGIDLVNTGRYRIQCKRGKFYASLMAIWEVQCDRGRGEVPVLLTKGDKREILAAMPLDSWLELVLAAAPIEARLPQLLAAATQQPVRGAKPAREAPIAPAPVSSPTPQAPKPVKARAERRNKYGFTKAELDAMW